MQRHRPSPKALMLTLAGLGLLVIGGYNSPANASLYGSGNYSACAEGTGCPSPAPTTNSTATPAPTNKSTPTPAPPTIIQTPGELKFAVNLSDGQIITTGSYLVTVTPLNGLGQTLSKAEFLVNERSLFVAQPDSTGTFSWKWSVPADGKVIVTVVLYDSAGQTTRRDIHVRIGSASNPVRAASPAAPPAASSNPLTAIAQTVTRLARHIPAPVAFSFPYLLLAMLGGGLLLLLAQARRETAEVQAIAGALAREQALAHDKATFVQLASHYLRTPLTVISGGLDILALKQAIPAPQKDTINRALGAVKTKVDNLLSEITESGQIPSPIGDLPAERLRIWLKPGFIAPLAFIGGLGLLFNALLAAAGSIGISLINTLTQLALFILLAILLYILLRSGVLRRRGRERIERLRAENAEIERARNTLIANSAQLLKDDLSQLKYQLSQLPEGEGTKLTLSGLSRFEVTLSKLAAAAKLEAGGIAAAAPQTFSLSALLNRAVANSASAAQAKNVHLQLPDDAQLTSRHPDWLGIVLGSLVDNAVAYSPPSSTIRIVSQSDPSRTTLTVSDEGPGIPVDKLASLFQPFSRADEALVFDHEGLGFSLYMDRLIMKYLEGDIHADPSPGRGLSVELSFPRQV